MGHWRNRQPRGNGRDIEMNGMALLVVLGTLAISVFAGWGVVELVFRLARVAPELEQRPTSGGHEATVLQHQPVHVMRGGTWIGILERLSISGAIVAGAPSLIAAVVAIKGLGRWFELQAYPSLTERFIIGTLASYFAASVCGHLGVWVLGQL